jgi:uncharacterized protein YrrD
MTMITKIHLQKDAVILSANGNRLGSLERVVVNPESNVVTDLVVRVGSLLKHAEKVLPIEYVAETSEGIILLQDTAGELEDFPAFEEAHIIEKESNVDSPSAASSEPPSMMGYPIGGMPITPVVMNRAVSRIERNIPVGTVAMKAGAPVLDADGKRVGSVERVLAEPTRDQITHMLISNGLLTKEIKLIPIKWILRVDEEAVRLRVDKASVENLAEEPLAG